MLLFLEGADGGTGSFNGTLVIVNCDFVDPLAVEVGDNVELVEVDVEDAALVVAVVLSVVFSVPIFSTVTERFLTALLEGAWPALDEVEELRRVKPGEVFGGVGTFFFPENLPLRLLESSSSLSGKSYSDRCFSLKSCFSSFLIGPPPVLAVVVSEEAASLSEEG